MKSHPHEGLAFVSLKQRPIPFAVCSAVTVLSLAFLAEENPRSPGGLAQKLMKLVGTQDLVCHHNSQAFKRQGEEEKRKQTIKADTQIILKG